MQSATPPATPTATSTDPDRPVAAAGSRYLVVRGLACRRGERILFRDFDLDLRPRELVWLRAANGYGKTSLLRVLAGLSTPEAGTIEWRAERSRGVAARKLFLGHANALKDDLTVFESIRHLARLHGLDASPSRMDDAIDRLGLRARRHAPVRTLSQGQRRRVALTRLCLSDPATTWILDEPFDALDGVGVEIVGTLLRAHATAGGNALFTSHVAPPIDAFATDVAPRIVQLDAVDATRATDAMNATGAAGAAAVA